MVGVAGVFLDWYGVMGTTRGVWGNAGGAEIGEVFRAGDLEGARPSDLRSLTRGGVAGMGTGLWRVGPPLLELVDPPLMILSILKELTRPPPLLCLGGDEGAAPPARDEAGLPAPPPSLLLPLLSVLSLCLFKLGEPFSKSNRLARFLGEMKCPSLTSIPWGRGLVGRRGMSAGDVR